MNDDNRIKLTRDEQLWKCALRGIGIQLSDEYILRFTMLFAAVKEKGLENVTTSDFADFVFLSHHLSETGVRDFKKNVYE